MSERCVYCEGIAVWGCCCGKEFCHECWKVHGPGCDYADQPFKLLIPPSELAEWLRDEQRRVADRDSQIAAMQTAWHRLISPEDDFYSWQRDWQNGARLLLDMPNASVDDIRLALAIRNIRVPGELL